MYIVELELLAIMFENHFFYLRMDTLHEISTAGARHGVTPGSTKIVMTTVEC